VTGFDLGVATTDEESSPVLVPLPRFRLDLLDSGGRRMRDDATGRSAVSPAVSWFGSDEQCSERERRRIRPAAGYPSTSVS
jgi:hypothetical protein